jgi:hypothetical protein
MSSRLMQRGLTAGGAATSLTLCSWMGEQTTSKMTSSIASRSLKGLVRNGNRGNLQNPLLRQQFKVFSTKNSEAASLNVASSSKPLTVTTKSSSSFVEWYEGHLENSPVYTKMVSGGILWGIGDAVAQLIPQMSFEKDNSNDESKSLTYDLPRTGRAVFFGFALHAPTSHVHFNFLEWMTNRVGVTGLGIPVFKTIMEQVRSLRFYLSMQMPQPKL